MEARKTKAAALSRTVKKRAPKKYFCPIFHCGRCLAGMKNSLLPLAILGLFASAQNTLLAEPPKIEHVIQTLQAAKEAKEPLPLLEEAHKELSDFKPVGNTAGIGRKKVAGIKAAAHDDKRDAMEAISNAINVAKEGGDVKPKINHAIALVHKSGDAKN
jgi:hypothetical protein